MIAEEKVTMDEGPTTISKAWNDSNEESQRRWHKVTKRVLGHEKTVRKAEVF